MSYINIHEIKARFSYYASLVAKGQQFIIANRNTPFALLSPLPANLRRKKLHFGVLQKQFEVPDNFNEKLVEFEGEFYGGR